MFVCEAFNSVTAASSSLRAHDEAVRRGFSVQLMDMNVQNFWIFRSAAGAVPNDHSQAFGVDSVGAAGNGVEDSPFDRWQLQAIRRDDHRTAARAYPGRAHAPPFG
jgi:hypothetical protein